MPKGKTEEQESTRRVGDVIPQDVPIKIDDILGNDVNILGIGEREGEHGLYLAVKVCTEDGDIHTVTTGGQVVIEKLMKLRDDGELPIVGRFVKVANYYDVY